MKTNTTEKNTGRSVPRLGDSLQVRDGGRLSPLRVCSAPCFTPRMQQALHESSAALGAEDSPVGLLRRRLGASACLSSPPEAWSSRRSRHPLAGAAVGEATHAAVGWPPKDRCPSPTWQDPPRGPAFHRAEERQRRNGQEGGRVCSAALILQFSEKLPRPSLMPPLTVEFRFQNAILRKSSKGQFVMLRLKAA